MRPFVIVTLLLLLVPLNAAFAQVNENAIGSDAFRQDLDFLANELPRRHKNLFAHLGKTEFESQVNSLRSRLDELNLVTYQLELSRLLASIGDGHTRLGMNFSDMHYFPFNARWFDDQVTVVAADRNYEDVLGAKITRINGLKIEDILARLRPFYPADNEFGFRHQIDQSFNHADMLAFACGFNIEEPMLFAFEKDGQSFNRRLPAIPHSQTTTLQWRFAAKQLPISEQKSSLDHWNNWLADSKTLYFKYNRCRNAEGFNRLLQGTTAFVKLNNPQRFVVDLRHNSGGNSAITKPLIDYLKNSDRFRQPGRLFVIVGRGTFSSGMFAAYDLKRIGAVVVGEPTGGKPNHYGEVKSIQLPNTKLPVYYSTRYWKFLDNQDPPSLVPDVPVRFTAKAMLAGEDPALKAILNYRGN